jgi:hypothetical protein
MTVPGGSAFAFAKDIGEGYQTVTERSFKALSKGEMETLAFELERALRDIRGEQAPLEDLVAIQARSRKIQRLNGALMMLRTYRQKARI